MMMSPKRKRAKSRDWAADLANDIDYFIQSISDSITLEEMAGDKDVPWRELVLRQSEQDAELAFNHLLETVGQYHEYFHAEDVCPGGTP
jgi:hypothetical protein